MLVLAQGHEKAQLDVLFPREGGVYRNVFPFPVVLSYRNIDKLWPASLCATWGVSGSYNGGSHCLEPDSKGKWAQPPDGTLIESVRVASGSEEEFELHVSARLNDVCDSGISGRQETNIRFRISESGEQPDIAAEVSKCPTAVWATSIEGRRETFLPDAQRFGSSCPVLANTMAENCLLQDNPEEIARQVAAEMIMVASCRYSSESIRWVLNEDSCSGRPEDSPLETCPSNLTWPSSELVKPCVFENGATAPRKSGFVTLLILLSIATSVLGAI
jgi:hypothetical protein